MRNIVNLSSAGIFRNLLFLTLTLLLAKESDGQSINGQNLSPKVSKSSFIEWNIGLANIHSKTYFPGTSVLYGMTFLTENNTIYEFEAGLALPSIITGKIGIGKQINRSKITVGVRPFPFNLYCSTSLPAGKNGNWVAALEYNFLDRDEFISFGSKAIFNVGYRWNLRSKK